MTERERMDVHRRQFLKFVAGSPLARALGQDPTKPDATKLDTPKLDTPKKEAVKTNPPKLDALNVMDFEEQAKRAMPPAHFGYLASGVDDDATLRANRDGFKRLQLRPRRMMDVTHGDLSVDLFGTRYETPIFLCPCGSQKAFHVDAEMGTAGAAKSRKTLQILSTMSTTPIEDVARANGKPIWYQLYPTSSWAVTETLVRHAEAAGCPVLVLTVDLTVGRNSETLERSKKLDARVCTQCHSTGAGHFARYPMFRGLDMNGVTTYNPAMSWNFVERLRKITNMKILLKGIETREDARLSRENGADGIVVSNHGGRAEESGRGTIECLPEVIDGAGAQLPVLIDGGFRRGTDIFKALALGARAVGVGRPYLWGLGAYGQPGVERVLDILRNELDLTMRQCGARSIAEINRTFVTGSL